jgi:excisionase family DNA binding protein
MSTEPDRNRQLWDAEDVAGYLKVSRSWVYHRAESGQLPHLRIGALLRFDPEAIHAFARGESTHGARVLAFPRKKV